ncbi:MAG: hypothetical protein OEM67_12145 [Thermoleophilia bacterium]|nr:hypothetical protein [Thermoleophilia bacterium]MDH3725017.1 hypothetical protein [Thermoleophilia bacterium]
MSEVPAEKSLADELEVTTASSASDSEEVFLDGLGERRRGIRGCRIAPGDCTSLSQRVAGAISEQSNNRLADISCRRVGHPVGDDR